MRPAFRTHGPVLGKRAGLRFWRRDLPPLGGLVSLAWSPDGRTPSYRSLHGKQDPLRWVVRFGEGTRIADLDLVDE